MEPQANDTPGPVDNPTEVVLENLDRLFVGVVTEEDASGSLRLMGPPAQSFPMQKSGEILLNGRIENGLFVLERVRRVALAGTLLSESLTPEQQAADPIGVFSLNGPLDSPRLEQTGEGVVDPLSIQLHYRALTFAGIRSGKTTLNEAGDAMFPPTVRMFGRIEWRQVGAATETSVPLTLKLSFTNDAETNRRIELENQVASILVEKEITIDFIWAASAPFEEAEEYAGGDGGALPFQPPLLAAVMLLAPCGPSALPCSQPRQELLLRQLPLRFVNLATTDPQQAATIAARCYEQVQGACEVWRQKAILRMLAPMVIAQGVRRIPLVPAAANLVNQFQNFVEDNGAMYEALVQIANLQSVTSNSRNLARLGRSHFG